ncbi:MAG: mechanosensitive ion channel family protein [Peptococcaceae bacterium]|nr:mechanosensitive ion channel family protein [Peptococcaceae bacterium]
MWQTVQQLFLRIVASFDVVALVKNIIYIIITLILAKVIYAGLNIALKKVLLREKGSSFLLKERRAKTLYPLLRSIMFYTIAFLAVINILPLIGVKTATILASVSAVGLAVGFGAQSLVKDVISGFFIIFEDQFAVGEYISVDKFDGIVEEIGIRSTRIRAWGGELHVIPNGSITAVTNFNQGKMRALVDINLAYDQDVEKAMQIIEQVGQELAKEFTDKLVEGPSVQGIITLGDVFLVVRTVAYTKAMEQWEIEREMRKRIVDALHKAGIRIPSPKQVFVESKSQ